MLVALTVGLFLTIHNNALALLRVPDRLSLPLNVALGAALVAFARLSGLTWAALGLVVEGVGAGVLWGLAVAVSVLAGASLAFRVPALRSLFADRRLEGLDPRSLAFRALVRMPLGTSAFEEVAFRGVLLGALASEVRLGWAVAVSSLLFGISHVGPALRMAHANPGRITPETTVVVTVLATSAAGVTFALLRVWTSGIVAPVLVHWAVNGAGAVGGWLAVRRPSEIREPAAGSEPGHPQQREE